MSLDYPGIIDSDHKQTIATRLDLHEQTTCFTDQERLFLWTYLGGPRANELSDACQHLFEVDQWSTEANQHKLEYATQYILRYRVIDVLMDVFGAEDHGLVPSVPRVAPPSSTTTRTALVRSSLQDWTKCVSKFQSLMASYDRRSNRSIEAHQPSTLQSNIVHAGVFNLLSARRHFAEANFSKALLNLELTAFALSWYAMVCLLL